MSSYMHPGSTTPGANVCTLLQVLELLSHVNKRIKGHNDIKLPLLALLELYNQNAGEPLVRNFSLVYMEMACERATAEERFEAVSSQNHSAHRRVCRVHFPCILLLSQPPHQSISVRRHR